MLTDKVLKEAKNLYKQDYSKILKTIGLLQPSRNKDPVNPPLTIQEYEGMEKDTSKYFLYFSAIYAQFQALKLQALNNSQISCMIVGAGLGRLVDYCIDSCQVLDINCMIYVVECNESASMFLQNKYKAINNVTVLSPFVVRTDEELLLGMQLNSLSVDVKSLMKSKPIDLFVSELLGSFGDNECVSEILSTCKNMFGKANCTSIPRAYTTYLGAVYSPSLELYFEKNNPHNMHILGLPGDAIFLTKLEKVYEQSCTEMQHTIDVPLKLERLPASGNFSPTGLAGYFCADLGHGIVVDSTPSASRNTFFWETAFFPLAKRQMPGEDQHMAVNFSRQVQIAKPDPLNLFDVRRGLITVCYSWALLNNKLLFADRQNCHAVRL